MTRNGKNIQIWVPGREHLITDVSNSNLKKLLLQSFAKLTTKSITNLIQREKIDGIINLRPENDIVHLAHGINGMSYYVAIASTVDEISPDDLDKFEIDHLIVVFATDNEAFIGEKVYEVKSFFPFPRPKVSNGSYDTDRLIEEKRVLFDFFLKYADKIPATEGEIDTLMGIFAEVSD